MRKALIAAAVATALFAVGAFAASFAVTSEDIASGSDQVVECAKSVKVEFDDSTWSNGAGAYQVSGATITFYSDTAFTTASTGCAGFTGKLSVTGAGKVQLSEGTFTVGASSSTATVTFTAANSQAVLGAAVLVQGKYLTVAPI